MEFFNENDLHGNRSTGTTTILGTNRSRRIRTAQKNLRHRARNGIYDPVTHYHLLDVLMQMKPGQIFRTTHLLPNLRLMKPEIIWDPVTVGRIITDMADALFDANGWKAIGATRRHDGMWFDVSSNSEARAVMWNLLEDLNRVAAEEIEAESRGEFAKRLASPMERCPSVAIIG
jgi:hypothetical protein